MLTIELRPKNSEDCLAIHRLRESDEAEVEIQVQVGYGSYRLIKVSFLELVYAIENVYRAKIFDCGFIAISQISPVDHEDRLLKISQSPNGIVFEIGVVEPDMGPDEVFDGENASITIPTSNVKALLEMWRKREF